MSTRPDFGEPTFDSPATDGVHVEIANAARRLLDAVALTGAEETELRAAIGAIDAVSAQLEHAGLRDRMPWPPMEKVIRGDRAYNPVAGPANPLSPPMLVWIDDDGQLASDVVMRPIHEGPPGGVHGGWVAALFDQLLGAANIMNGVGAMTAELTIRYRRVTPIGVPLEIRARTESIEGRKVRTSGEITANGVVTAEAAGLFILTSQQRPD